MAAVRSHSDILRGIDAKVREASGAWKSLVWEHTLSATKAEELQGACSALMDQLVTITSHAEADKTALMQRMVDALFRAWVRRKRAAGMAARARRAAAEAAFNNDEEQHHG
jgi:hypothetical protein